MDLGANWANTMRLYPVLERHVRRATLSPVDVTPFNNCTHEWEVYSFEPSPVMQPFVDAFARHLNGEGARPEILVPPVGSSIQMLAYAKHFGCPSRHNRSEYTAMYRCMNRIFAEPYSRLAVDPALNSSALLRKRLHEAATPNRASSTRYTFVPAAVGAEAGTLENPWPSGVLINVTEEPPEELVPRPSRVPVEMSVAIVDWVAWLKQHFTETDIVVVKMDVEGAEHEILDRMMRESSIGLIDVLGLECHTKHRNGQVCKSLYNRLTQSGVRLVSEASYSPSSSGVDPFSYAQDFMPVDPRPGHGGGGR